MFILDATCYANHENISHATVSLDQEELFDLIHVVIYLIDLGIFISCIQMSTASSK